MYPPDPSATVAVDVEHTYLPGTYDTHLIHSFIHSFTTQRQLQIIDRLDGS